MPTRKGTNKTDVKEILPYREVVYKIMRHASLKKEIDVREKEREEITKYLKEQLPEIGNKDEKGSFIYTEEVAGVTCTAKSTKRVSSKLVPEAEELLIASKEYRKYVEKQEILVVNEAMLEADILAGKVDAKMVERLYKISTTFSLTTEVK